MPWFGFIPILVLVLVLISLTTAIISKSRSRIIVALVLLCVAGSLFFVRATMMPDRRFDPRRGIRYPRYYPDVQEVQPAPSPDARLSAAEDEAMLRMLQSMPETAPTPPLPPPSLPSDIVLPTDPPMYQRGLSPSTSAATQPSSGKPWIDNWSAFVSNQRRDQNLIRTYVTMPAVDPDEARQLATDAAVRSLRPLLVARLASKRPASVWNDRALDEQLRGAIASGELIVDQFSEPTTKAYGTLWKHELLLDASPVKLDPIIRRISSTTIQTRTRQLTTAGAVGGMTAVTVLLYLFLNFATRGYFVWRLRAAAIMAVIVVLLAAITLV